jgi:hypothetical protein
MSNATIRKTLIYLSAAFVVVSIWRDPAGSANAAGNFLGSVGNFFSTAIDKVSTFLRGLAKDDTPQTPIPTPTTVGT